MTSSLPTLSQASVTTDSINMSSEISEIDMSTSDDVIKVGHSVQCEFWSTNNV